jgi:hypothetical protein
VLATAVPHAPFEQSRIPKPKFTLLQRQEGSGVAHPREEYWAIKALKHVWPHDGKAAIPVAVARAVAEAEAQYELSYAIRVLATAVPHAPFEQSRIPNPKLTLLHRHNGSGVAHPREEYWAIKALKHVWPHDGRAAMPVAVVVAFTVAAAEEQYKLSYAMTVLPTLVPQAPLAQSRMPKPKLTFWQRQDGSGDEQPRVEY